MLKGDIPQVGTFLNMKNHQKTARMYSIENVEIAHKAIFDSSRSISYNGPHDMLKIGLWVPTRVGLFLTLALQSINSVLVERIRD